MNNDTIVAIATALLALIIFVGAWWADREHTRIIREFQERDRVALWKTAGLPRRKEGRKEKT